MYLLITTAQADKVLPDDWADLDSAVKKSHIQQASLYTRATWTCTGIDFSTSPVLPDLMVQGVAKYAYHDYKGELHNPEQVHVKRVKLKAGSVESDKEFIRNRRNAKIAYIDYFFTPLCERNNTVPKLVRV